VKKISDVVPRLDRKSALEHEFEISALLFSRSESRENMKKMLEDMKRKKKK